MKTAINNIIEFCEKQKTNDVSSHRGAYSTIIKFCEEQVKDLENEKQSYNQLEVLSIIYDFCETFKVDLILRKDFNKWFEQFKNK